MDLDIPRICELLNKREEIDPEFAGILNSLDSLSYINNNMNGIMEYRK